jgi:hypothetical protein
VKEEADGELRLRAEWQGDDLDGGDARSARLSIAGLKALILFRGDVWEWEVSQDDFLSPPVGEGWVASRDEAIAAAEACIKDCFD